MKKLLLLIGVAFVLGLMVSCSTKKNTALTRSVQAFKARYNTYFNGHQAFLEGVDEQRNGNKDNFTEIIPLFMTANKGTVTLGKGKFERAVEKSQKTIKQHSITVKPQWNGNRPKKPKDRIWLSQKEYNPFLYKAWFLMGEAQMRKGDYIEASATFAYIQRLYATHPDIVARARLLEAECYAAQDWVYDAENLLNDVRRDSFPTRLEPLRAAVTADCQLRQQQWAEAIPNVRRALRAAHGTLEKARVHFLLGQLYRQAGDTKMAFKEFRRVIRLNPPYEIAFNARIQQTEVMQRGQYKQMIRKLKAMARNPKNKDYLDQVYYAIGNIYLAQGDTTHAVYAYKAGVDQSTRGGIEKGVVWLHLGKLYWEQEEFVKAQPCYAGALGLFDKERADYKQIAERASILEELLPYASAVELQDSLQALARMDTTEMLKVIDNLIHELKEKERKEQRAAVDAATPGATGAGAAGTASGQQATQAQQTTAKGQWYFYNAASVAAGKRDFQQKWGQRKLEDNWRRSNKTTFGEQGDGGEADTTGVNAADSVGTDSALLKQMEGLSAEEQEQLLKQQEYEKDPHRREYYLKDIPFTAEQKAVSDAALAEGLYGSAVIYKDRMENFPLAMRTFQRLLVEFPDFGQTDEVCYNMYQLHARQGMEEDAEAYRQRLITGWPDNEHAKLVSDPNFIYKGTYGRQIEDSLYQQAYAAFQRGDYATVLRHASYTAREYPEGKNRARFLFIEALSRLEQGDQRQFLADMKRIVSDYPQATVSELAGLYVKGLQDGRILAGGHMDFGSLWTRRTAFGAEGDSTLTDTLFSADRLAPFVFVVAYMSDSIDENQLLYEVARYNFTNFAVRSFDLSLVPAAGISMLQVRTFRGYEEAYVYTHRLFNDPDMARKLEGLRTFIISEDNLGRLMRGRSFADYFEFYDDNFDPLSRVQLELERAILDEPATGDLPTQEELQLRQEEEERQLRQEEEEEEENYIF